MPQKHRLLWTPSPDFIGDSNLFRYKQWLKSHKGLDFEDYHEMWSWSTDHVSEFWQSIWEYFQIAADGTFSQVVNKSMPDCEWFEGTALSYAEHVFRQKNEKHPAIIHKKEGQGICEISWSEMESEVAQLANYLRSIGVGRGDRVVAFLPNTPEATIAFLATNSIGAIWSSCSPDFGSRSVIDRFLQIEPKVLFAVDGYYYNGKEFDKRRVVHEILDALVTVKHVIEVAYLSTESHSSVNKSKKWREIFEETPASPLVFERVPFGHPIWILYSSGTTGQPKAITHSCGGVLLEHLKYLTFHNDVKPGEKFFWYTTTGWMMWNFVQASLLAGATIVLYDGSPGFPDMNVLWNFASEIGIEHFGTSAPFILACLKENISPKSRHDFSFLRSISSTGAPLPPEGFDWIYEQVHENIWLCSMSGGTDVCSAFVGGCPFEPVYEGEIQCRALGCAMYSFDEKGQPVYNKVGEMVVTKPMPSMPIFFWNDHDKSIYTGSYFEMYEGVWRHGDWLKITDIKTLEILGRSDATLNRHGIRIGTAEIYQVIDRFPQIKDSLIVNLELSGGNHLMPLFVVMNEGHTLKESLEEEINKSLKSAYTPRHIPDRIISVDDIPYTISGKKMEAPVKKILLGIDKDKAANLGAMRNPESLDFFISFAESIRELRHQV